MSRRVAISWKTWTDMFMNDLASLQQSEPHPTQSSAWSRVVVKLFLSRRQSQNEGLLLHVVNCIKSAPKPSPMLRRQTCLEKRDRLRMACFGKNLRKSQPSLPKPSSGAPAPQNHSSHHRRNPRPDADNNSFTISNTHNSTIPAAVYEV